MHIALTADPELPVPPLHYGGIERIVDMLARALVARGHRVTLFAHRDSRSAGRLVPWLGNSSRSPSSTLQNSLLLRDEVARGGFDVVHSFSRLAYMLPILPWRVPKLMTYQRAISRRSVRLGHILARGSLEFTAISRSMMAPVADIGRWHLVYNGVPIARYDFKDSVGPDAPLVFLGRVEEIKGPHVAIEVARRTGSRLVIAGNIPDEHRAWFQEVLAPQIDGHQIRYIGPLDDFQKNALLGSARAFLMPILWDEPFGIVMAEAMACGTPVIAFRRGAASEVVEDGVTGFVVRTADEMVAVAQRLDSLQRGRVRRRAERHFSSDVIADDYIACYRNMMDRTSDLVKKANTV